MNALRLPLAFLFALAFTGTMFWFLWYLIHSSSHFAELKPVSRIEFTPLRRDTEVKSARDEKVTRERPAEMPDIPNMSAGSSGTVGAEQVTMITPEVDPQGAMRGIAISAGSDRDVVPLVRINPDYPARAAQRGIEGWVMVEFTITASGTVKDARVINSEPKGMFDDAALKAIARWKYNPKVEEGVAVERRGIRVVLRFELEN